MKEQFQGHIGADESGKGDYFGYLVVGAVFVDESAAAALRKLGVVDSKKLSDMKVNELDKQIRKACKYEIVKISPEKYNSLYSKFKSLNYMLAWAHATAIESLSKKTGCNRVIVDKFAKEALLDAEISRRKLALRVEQRVRAEEDVAVAAASIIARAEFLRTLRQLGRTVGFVLPKGATHVEAAARQILEKHGKEVPDILSKVAKLHFKTTKKIVS